MAIGRNQQYETFVFRSDCRVEQTEHGIVLHVPCVHDDRVRVELTKLLKDADYNDIEIRVMQQALHDVNRQSILRHALIAD